MRRYDEDYKTMFFVSSNYVDETGCGGCEDVRWYTEEWEALEDADDRWNEADDEKRSNGFYILVEVCEEVPDDVDEDDAYEFIYREGLYIECLEKYVEDDE